MPTRKPDPPKPKPGPADEPKAKAPTLRSESESEPPVAAQLPAVPPGGPPILPPGQAAKLAPPIPASEGLVPDLRVTQSEIKRGGGVPPGGGPPVAKTPPPEPPFGERRETN